MVRGVSRRVIVVKPEQPALFEQAIFPCAGLQCAARRHGARPAASPTAICRADGGREERRDGLFLLAGFSAGALLIGTIWALTALVL